jgi:YidC/Oxa1 family membrane protein insertase
MEQKKFDLNSIIGFALIFAILVFIMYQNQPDPKVVAAEKAQKELVIKEAKAKELSDKTVATATVAVAATGDSTQLAQLQKTLGNFAYSATLPSAKATYTTIENELVKLKIANISANLKKFLV